MNFKLICCIFNLILVCNSIVCNSVARAESEENNNNRKVNETTLNNCKLSCQFLD